MRASPTLLLTSAPKQLPQFLSSLSYTSWKVQAPTSSRTEENAAFTGLFASSKSIFTIREITPICCCPEMSIKSIDASTHKTASSQIALSQGISNNDTLKLICSFSLRV